MHRSPMLTVDDLQLLCRGICNEAAEIVVVVLPQSAGLGGHRRLQHLEMGAQLTLQFLVLQP